MERLHGRVRLEKGDTSTKRPVRMRRGRGVVVFPLFTMSATMINRLRHLALPGITQEATSYTDFYELEALGDTHIVSLGTVLAVERQLDQCAMPEWLEFRDVFGARHRLPARCVYRITESTRATRAAVRAFRKAMIDEAKNDEDPLAGIL